MTDPSWLLGTIGLLCIADAALFVLARRRCRSQPDFDQQTAIAIGDEQEWPSLSVLVPACNEESTLEPALRSLLESDYPRLEVVVINDRSTDSTGTIADRLAADDPRVEVLHIETLPEGWLGKNHALHRGAKQAQGDWLLFTDADVHFSPSALRRGVGMAQDRAVDLLAVIPNMTGQTHLHNALLSVFATIIFMHLRLGRLADPAHPAAVGVGAFNLVRSDVWRAGAGFEGIPMEVADDMAVGMLVKQASGRIALASTAVHLHCTWYPSIGAMFAGMEKNLFGVAFQWRFTHLLLAMVVAIPMLLAPFAALTTGSSTTAMLGGVALTARYGMAHALSQRGTVEWQAVLLFPVGQLLLVGLVLRSAAATFRHQGIHWRGTHYSLEALREGQRFKPPLFGG